MGAHSKPWAYLCCGPDIGPPHYQRRHHRRMARQSRHVKRRASVLPIEPERAAGTCHQGRGLRLPASAAATCNPAEAKHLPRACRRGRARVAGGGRTHHRLPLVHVRSGFQQPPRRRDAPARRGIEEARHGVLVLRRAPPRPRPRGPVLSEVDHSLSRRAWHCHGAREAPEFTNVFRSRCESAPVPLGTRGNGRPPLRRACLVRSEYRTAGVDSRGRCARNVCAR